VFDWYEQLLGPYPFGPEYASVEVFWTSEKYGGAIHPILRVFRES